MSILGHSLTLLYEYSRSFAHTLVRVFSVIRSHTSREPVAALVFETHDVLEDQPIALEEYGVVLTQLYKLQAKPDTCGEYILLASNTGASLAELLKNPTIKVRICPFCFFQAVSCRPPGPPCLSVTSPQIPLASLLALTRTELACVHLFIQQSSSISHCPVHLAGDCTGPDQIDAAKRPLVSISDQQQRKHPLDSMCPFCRLQAQHHQPSAISSPCTRSHRDQSRSSRRGPPLCLERAFGSDLLWQPTHRHGYSAARSGQLHSTQRCKSLAPGRLPCHECRSESFGAVSQRSECTRRSLAHAIQQTRRPR
jgi:hypothetical protein